MAAILLSYLYSTFTKRQTLFANSYRFITSTKVSSHNDSSNPEEVEKFNKYAGHWWDANSLLRRMNSVRVPFVRDGILSQSSLVNKNSAKPLKGYEILDIGCGGGVLCEPLARLGAFVTGIDPSSESINIAKDHSLLDKDINQNLNYVCTNTEDFLKDNPKFDAVICSEVIEHVNNVKDFIKTCLNFVKPGGSIFFTTPNRSLASCFMIFASEYVFRIVPQGTHEWNKFVPDKELCEILEANNCRIVSIDGLIYNPFTKSWNWSRYKMFDYAVHAIV